MSDYIELIYDSIVHRTAKAVLFNFGEEKRWIPISVMHPDSFPLNEMGGEVIVEQWFVEKEGLEGFEA